MLWLSGQGNNVHVLVDGIQRQYGLDRWAVDSKAVVALQCGAQPAITVTAIKLRKSHSKTMFFLSFMEAQQRPR